MALLGVGRRVSSRREFEAAGGEGAEGRGSQVVEDDSRLDDEAASCWRGRFDEAVRRRAGGHAGGGCGWAGEDEGLVVDAALVAADGEGLVGAVVEAVAADDRRSASPR